MSSAFFDQTELGVYRRLPIWVRFGTIDQSKWLGEATIHRFCTKILKMHIPVLSDYHETKMRTTLTIRDIHTAKGKKTVRFCCLNVTNYITVEYTFVDGSTVICDTIDFDTYRSWLNDSEIVPAHVYYLRDDFVIVRRECFYGVTGVYGVISHGLDPDPEAMRLVDYGYYPMLEEPPWLRQHRDSKSLSSCLAFVWYPYRNDKEATEVLNSLLSEDKDIRKLHIQYLKKKVKTLKNKEAQRAKHRKNYTYLKNLFVWVGGNPKLASRLTAILIRSFGIYNLSDFRSKPIRYFDLASCRGVGSATISLYMDARTLVERLPNATVL